MSKEQDELDGQAALDEANNLIVKLRDRLQFLERQIEERHAPWCDTYKQEGDYGYSGKGCNCFDPKV